MSKREACDEFNMLDFLLDNNLKEIDTDVYEAPHKYFKDISPQIVQPGWQHFAFVRKGTRGYTYLNGQLHKMVKRCSGLDITNDTSLRPSAF